MVRNGSKTPNWNLNLGKKSIASLRSENLCTKPLYFFFFVTTVANAQEWSWAGFEVLGNHSISREAILKVVLIQIGGKYQEDTEAWKDGRHVLVMEKPLGGKYSN